MVIAAFTTGLAHFKLLSSLESDGHNALYKDMDSVIVIQKQNFDLLQDLLWENLGKLTNDIGTGAFISKKISGTHELCYRCFNGSEIWKICAIWLYLADLQHTAVHCLWCDQVHVTAAEGAEEPLKCHDSEIICKKKMATFINRDMHETFSFHFMKGFVDEMLTVYHMDN